MNLYTKIACHWIVFCLELFCNTKDLLSDKIRITMEIKICKPNEIEEIFLCQIIDLIVNGGQIKSDRSGIRLLLSLADYVAFKHIGNLVISTATLKNQYTTYKEKVFSLANAMYSDRYNKELGYIVTNPDFQNQGHCQDLLETFFNQIKTHSIYATTRKASMIHILNKLGFRQSGQIYNQDLTLLVYDFKVFTEFSYLLGGFEISTAPLNRNSTVKN